MLHPIFGVTPADAANPSQAEAEAGTATTERVWTAERVKQAIAALETAVAAATQAEMETATSTAVMSTPGRQQFHPGHPKGWAFVQSDATLSANFNVSSITDQATGDHLVVWNVDFSSAAYACVASICADTDVGSAHVLNASVHNILAASANVEAGNANTGTQADTDFAVIACGDQA